MQGEEQVSSLLCYLTNSRTCANAKQENGGDRDQIRSGRSQELRRVHLRGSAATVDTPFAV